MRLHTQLLLSARSSMVLSRVPSRSKTTDANIRSIHFFLAGIKQAVTVCQPQTVQGYRTPPGQAEPKLTAPNTAGKRILPAHRRRAAQNANVVVGQATKFSTLSTEFSTFNFCFAHPPWKEKQLQPFPQAFHTAFTIRWKTTEPHSPTSLPTFHNYQVAESILCH